MSPLHYRGGALHLEGVALAAVAERFGTPCYVYSRAAIEAALPRIRAAGKAAGVYCADAQIAAEYAALGASFFLIAADAILLRTAAVAAISRFQS